MIKYNNHKVMFYCLINILIQFNKILNIKLVTKYGTYMYIKLFY